MWEPTRRAAVLGKVLYLAFSFASQVYAYKFTPRRPIVIFQTPENFLADVTLNKTKKLGDISADSYWCLKAVIPMLKLLLLKVREEQAPVTV